MNFVKTKDLETYEKLIKEGFQLLDKSNGIYTFINNPNCFTDIDQKKVIYTNKLFI